MSGTHRQRRKALSLLLVAALAVGVGVLAHATHLLRRSELQTIDARFSVRGKQALPRDVELVEINQPTLTELRNRGLQSEFPLPRSYDAKVVDNLRRAGATVIAMDLEFTHPVEKEEETVALFEALRRAHGKTVLATVEVAPGGRTEVFGGHLREIRARAGDARFPTDSDGSIRDFEYSYRELRSFAVVATEIAEAHPISASRFERGQLPIDFVGPSGTIGALSYYNALTGRFNANAVRGKVVIVGATAPILQDIHPTATSAGMPGPEIWANSISTLLRGIPLRNVPGWVNILSILILGAVVPLGSLRLRQWRSLLDALALAIVFTVAVQVAFNSGWIVSFVYPLLALAVGALGTLAVLYVGEMIERARVHDLFSRFVPADVVDQVVASAGDNLRLGAVERDCTVLFSDLRGFTSFSEKLPATRVIEVVNTYLNEMTEAILGAGGTLIAYMGDGIMAVFGAPLEQPDHADRALAAATEMIDRRLDAFNAWISKNGHDHEFVMGVGINSGPVMAGNIGSEQRVEYTALGDTTNTASRLEGMTKGSGHMLFIADTTRERLHDPPGDLVLVGELEIRGRVAPVPVWTIAKPEQSAAPVGHVVAEDAPTGPAGTS
ncbi:MAG: adenylate/guanylate cyclase protein [Solirubrobacterales bacterium]|nr:adenylate/guanylate cyclase protein [Solirubrobacterales bacterium]